MKFLSLCTVLMFITPLLMANPFVGRWNVMDDDPAADSQTMQFHEDMRLNTYTFSELAGTGTYAFTGTDQISITIHGEDVSTFRYEFKGADEWHFFLPPEVFYTLMPNKDELLAAIMETEGLPEEEALAYLFEMVTVLSNEPMIIGKRIQ